MRIENYKLPINITGKCRMVLDDGKQEDVWLESPYKGIVINRWSGMRCTNSVPTVYCWCWLAKI
jgi:hypothetical protein